jgi:hypothetical protein
MKRDMERLLGAAMRLAQEPATRAHGRPSPIAGRKSDARPEVA